MSTDTNLPLPDEEPIGLRERGRQERFARVLTAAEELFIAKGFDAVTTREVAQLAGVGEATLFRYVANKTDLLLLVIGRTQDSLIDDIVLSDRRTEDHSPEAPSGEWYIDRIAAIYRERIRYYTLDPENVAKYVVSGLQSSGSRLGERSTRAGDRIIELVRNIVVTAQERRVFRDDVDPTLVARNLNGCYIHEVLRSPARNLPIETTWDRLHERFDVMLRPLLVTVD